MLDLYEIVVLSDGDIVLQRSDDGAEPLVRISFSEEAHAYIEGKSIEVAKAMIDAVIETVEHASDAAEDIEGFADVKSVVLH